MVSENTRKLEACIQFLCFMIQTKRSIILVSDSLVNKPFNILYLRIQNTPPKLMYENNRSYWETRLVTMLASLLVSLLLIGSTSAHYSLYVWEPVSRLAAPLLQCTEEQQAVIRFLSSGGVKMADGRYISQIATSIRQQLSGPKKSVRVGGVIQTRKKNRSVWRASWQTMDMEGPIMNITRRKVIVSF